LQVSGQDFILTIAPEFWPFPGSEVFYYTSSTLSRKYIIIIELKLGYVIIFDVHLVRLGEGGYRFFGIPGNELLQLPGFSLLRRGTFYNGI
jgi:hypothetical protein